MLLTPAIATDGVTGALLPTDRRPDPGAELRRSPIGSRVRATEGVFAQLRAQLRSAIEAGQFVVTFHPRAGLDGDPQVVDAVVWWDHPTMGRLPRSSFLPGLERSPHAASVTREVLAVATRQAARWRAPRTSTLVVAVPVDARELGDGRLVRRVDQVLRSSGLPASRLLLTIVGPDPRPRTVADRSIERLRAIGVGVEWHERTWGPC